MDSATQLALIAKATKVFGNDQTFLSFPVTPLPFTKQELSFLDDQNLQNLQTFSSLVNLLPNGEAWLPTESHYLWDVYDEVLKQADLASSTRTPAEEAEYQKAFCYLYVAHEDGTREDTDFVKIYKQHKDAFLLAQQNYLAAKGTAEYSTDSAEKQQWQEVDEPTLRAELESCETLWVIQGYKNEVEEAQATIFILGARSPLQTWMEWKGRFNRDLDTLTSAIDLSSVFGSSFSPSNALDEGAWKPFKLTGAEVKALVAEAPAELRARLAIGSGDSPIASLAFEFSSATIVRPWFESDVFKARCWRFSDSSQMLSDGSTPPSGLCPSYVTAIVFARNLLVETKSTLSTGEETASFENFHLPIVALAPEKLHLLRPQIRLDPGGWRSQSPTELKAKAPVVPTKQTISPAKFPSPNLPINAPVTGLQPLKATVVQPVNFVSPQFRALQRVVFTRLTPLSKQDEASGTPGRPSYQPSPPATQDEAIYILAFICKLLPRCPDPDPTLQW